MIPTGIKSTEMNAGIKNLFDPLELLTNDGWEHVFAKLDSPSDIKNLASTHTTFRSIFNSDAELRQRWIQSLMFLSFANLAKYLSRVDVLNLRLVNTNFKSTVDCYIQRHQIPAFLGKTKSVDLTTALYPRNVEETFPKLLNSLNQLPIQKLVPLSICSDLLQRNYPESLRFFRIHGNQVLALNLGINPSLNPHPLQSQAWLKDVLNSVPNLKTLFFALGGPCQELGVPYELWANRVKIFWQENLFPELKYLENVVVNLHRDFEDSSFKSYGDSTWQAFWNVYANQIKALSFCRGNFLLPTQAHLTALQQIQLDLESVEDIETLQTLRASLKQVKLRILSASVLKFNQVFTALENFKETLVYIQIECIAWMHKPIQDFPQTMHWPSLEILDVFWYFDGTLEELLLIFENMSNLKVLKVFLSSRFQLRPCTYMGMYRNHLEFHANKQFEPSGKKGFYRSKIWTTFPKLQILQVKFDNGIVETFDRNTFRLLRS